MSVVHFRPYSAVSCGTQLRILWGTVFANTALIENSTIGVYCPLTKKYATISLSLVVIFLSLALPSQATAQANTDTEKVRARVKLLSMSADSQVEVRFRDKTKLKGYITSVGPVSFDLKDSKAGTPQSIAYSEIVSVNKTGGGISSKTWLIIGGVAAGAVTTWLIVKPALCDGGAQTRGPC